MKGLLTLSFALFALMWTGCISRYYWGANLHPDGGALVRPVPRRLDRELHNFSQTCIEQLLNKDVDAIKSSAGDDLQHLMAKEDVESRLKEIQVEYGLNGNFEQINSTGGGLSLDESISKDPYLLYDFFVTEYMLRGTTDAHAFLIIKKISNGFSLLGFDIHSADHGSKNTNIAYIPSGLKGWKWFH